MSFVLILQIFILSWFTKTLKNVLFWIYLWQLKEYHVGRFLDHFRTHKGKKIFINFFYISKFTSLILVLLNSYLFYIVFVFLFFVYLTEFLIFIKNVVLKSLKMPKFTAKAIILTSISFALVVLYVFIAAEYLKIAYWQTFFVWVLLFDILTPLFVSLVVLVLQPFFVVARNNILKKAKRKMENFDNLTVIGITGSYGKTSTKEFLTTILSKKFNVLSTKEHQNSEIGIAKCILDNLTDKHEIFVVEMGAYKKGGISLLCDIVKPKIGVVTGVNEQHLATFGSMDNLISAEGGKELAESLPRNGLIVLNGDNKYCLNLYKRVRDRKRIYTLKKGKIDSDIWTEDIVLRKNSVSFIAMSRGKEMVHFNVNVSGKQNIQNILGAVLVAKELGMSLEEISKACENIKPEQAGIALKEGIHGINIIDSSYSSNPDGVMADLDYLGIFGGRKVIVMPCLIELGKKSAEVHGQIGKKIAEVCDMAIITTKDKFEDIKSGAIMGGMLPDKIKLSDNPKEIFHIITTFCKEGDAILLEGRAPSELIKSLINK